MKAVDTGASWEELPSISVVICTFNVASYVDRCLKSLFDANFPKDKMEIICADDGSSDETLEVLMRARVNHPINIVSTGERLGRAKARNLGIERAAGDIVLCVDSDSEVDSEMLYHHAVHYRDPDCHWVAGKILQAGGSNVVSRCWETMPWIRIQKMDKDMIKRGLSWCPSGNVSFRAVCVKETLFDEKIRGHGEDVDLGWMMAKRGHKPVREEKAIIFHRRKTSLLELIPDMFSRGKSEVTIGTKYQSRLVDVAPSFVTSLIFLILLASFVSLFFWRSFLIAPIFLVEYVCTDFISYAAGHKTFGYYGYTGSSLRDKMAAWPIFFLLRVSFETGKIYEAFRTGRPKLLIKRVRYTDHTSKEPKLTLHSWTLITTIILALFYVIYM